MVTVVNGHDPKSIRAVVLTSLHLKHRFHYIYIYLDVLNQANNALSYPVLNNATTALPNISRTSKKFIYLPRYVPNFTVIHQTMLELTFNIHKLPYSYTD